MSINTNIIDPNMSWNYIISIYLLLTSLSFFFNLEKNVFTVIVDASSFSYCIQKQNLAEVTDIKIWTTWKLNIVWVAATHSQNPQNFLLSFWELKGIFLWTFNCYFLFLVGWGRSCSNTL